MSLTTDQLIAAPPRIENPSGAGRNTSAPRRRSRAWRRVGLSIAAVVFSTLAAWSLSQTSPLRQLELKLYDQTVIWAGSRTPPVNIAIVAMDEKTEQAIPAPRILWHPEYAALMRALARGDAKAAAFDVFLAIPVEQWAPDYDRQIAEAFSETSLGTPMVMAYDTRTDLPALPLYLLANTQQLVGYANVTLDPDGFIRRQQLISGDGAVQSLAARLAAVSSGKEWNSAEFVAGKSQELKLGNGVIPLDEEKAVEIAYYGPAGTFERISMIDALRAADSKSDATLKKMFEGKTVLVGTLESSDQQPTPFYRATDEPQLTPGVEIHANVLAALQEGRFLHRATSWATALVMILAAAMGSLLARWSESKRRLAFGTAGILALAGSYLFIATQTLRAGLILPGVPVLLSLASAAGATYAASSLTEGRQRRLLQEVFGRYVSDDVAKELLNYGDIPLGGNRQMVTVMFTDLRNFTDYSEGRDPHQLVMELNEYFGGMSAEIKKHRGMINKFIGDGIMALWGAPVEHADDARRAVACGLSMVTVNREFNERRATQGKSPLRVGIGIHTGMAMVGNVGAPEKMEYTANGDTVNRASRIESANKTYGTQLLVSETTYHLVSDIVAARCVGNVQMKGVAESMALYEVTGLK
jgi:adenylate cyclase